LKGRPTDRDAIFNLRSTWPGVPTACWAPTTPAVPTAVRPQAHVLGRGADDRLWRRELRRVEVQELHQRTDLREGKIPEIEDVSTAALLYQFSTLSQKFGLRLAYKFQTWVDEAGMVKSLSILFQMLIVDTPTAVGRDEFVCSATYSGQRDAEREGTFLSAHLALRGFDRPYVPRSDSQRV
jgi:hypothetical protein